MLTTVFSGTQGMKDYNCAAAAFIKDILKKILLKLFIFK